MFSACACMGKVENDPFCPCKMAEKGLDGAYNRPKTPEEEAKLREFVKKMGERFSECTQK